MPVWRRTQNWENAAPPASVPPPAPDENEVDPLGHYGRARQAVGRYRPALEGSDSKILGQQFSSWRGMAAKTGADPGAVARHTGMMADRVAVGQNAIGADEQRWTDWFNATTPAEYARLGSIRDAGDALIKQRFAKKKKKKAGGAAPVVGSDWNPGGLPFGPEWVGLPPGTNVRNWLVGIQQ